MNGEPLYVELPLPPPPEKDKTTRSDWYRGVMVIDLDGEVTKKISYEDSNAS
jgi:hypothetical protein